MMFVTYSYMILKNNNVCIYKQMHTYTHIYCDKVNVANNWWVQMKGMWKFSVLNQLPGRVKSTLKSHIKLKYRFAIAEQENTQLTQTWRWSFSMHFVFSSSTLKSRNQLKKASKFAIKQQTKPNPLNSSRKSVSDWLVLFFFPFSGDHQASILDITKLFLIIEYTFVSFVWGRNKTQT